RVLSELCPRAVHKIPRERCHAARPNPSRSAGASPVKLAFPPVLLVEHADRGRNVQLDVAQVGRCEGLEDAREGLAGTGCVSVLTPQDTLRELDDHPLVLLRILE